MEKIIWVKSYGSVYDDDGLNEVNSYLEQGWKVKMISTCPNGCNCYAYVVIEKEEK